MHEPAFYLPPELWGQDVCLQGQEARHLAKVLRLAVGASVILLDGRGRLGRFSICGIAGTSVRLERLEEQFILRPTACAVMALAVSKAVRRGFFLEKAVELGANAIWIWQAAHSQNNLSASSAQSWQAQMIAGAKQCKNPWLPELRLFPGGIDDVLSAASTADHRIFLWEKQANIPLLSVDMAGQEGITVYLVGPEGGFSQGELAAITTAAFTTVSLGTRILRCETAATLCLGLHWWASHSREATTASP